MWNDDEEPIHNEAGDKFYDRATGRLKGTPDQLLQGFFSNSLNFSPEYKGEMEDIESGLKEIERTVDRYDLDKDDGRIAGGKNQRQDLEKYFKEQFRREKRRDWTSEEFLRAIEKHFEDYSRLVYQQAEEIRERRERERRKEKEERDARDVEKRVKFQHEGGKPDFLPKNSVQTRTGTWEAPNGTVYRRISTHEWSDGNKIWDDRESYKQQQYSPVPDGVYSGHNSVAGSYLMVIVAIVVVLLILSALGVQFTL